MNENKNKNGIETFKVGETYACRSACNYDCIFFATVIRRTAKTVTFKEENRGVYTRRINTYLTAINGNETVYPYGQYSMAPIFSAERTLEIVRAAS